MAGLYIHVPFCASRCIYCDFYSQTNAQLKKDFVVALCREIELSKDSLTEFAPFSTVYFGGGTPSLLSIHELATIIECLLSNVSILPSAEWTLEANPDDVRLDYAHGLKGLGVNRVSLGVQSFSDRELAFLGRRHSGEQVYQAIDALRRESINNISVDLIYALPNQTKEQWHKNVQNAIELEVPHISSYHLICEENTPLYKLVDRGAIVLPKEEQGIEAYYYLVQELERVGFKHYEISNFAKEGYISCHNSAYWNRTPYFGLGPSAHSYIPERRWSNVADLRSYIDRVGLNELPKDFEERLSLKDQYNEWIMLGLRTREGIDTKLLQESLGQEYYTLLKRQAAPFCQKGWLEWKGNYLQSTSQGFIFVDGIIRDIFSL